MNGAYFCLLLGYNASDSLNLGSILILHRYINRQLFAATTVVGFVLTIVMVSGRFIRYLADAATGKISTDAVFKVLALRMPEFLQMILPLAFFIAILLVFGRMYVDNEMSSVRAGGKGPIGDARAIVLPVVCMTLLMAVFSLGISPKGSNEAAAIFNEQASRSALELVTPGRFLITDDNKDWRATYIEEVDRKQGVLKNVFMSQSRYGNAKNADKVITVRAKEGHLVTQDDGINYLKLDDGTEFQGKPGDADYTVMNFDRALVRIDRNESTAEPVKVRGWPVAELLSSDRNDAQAEWQWRLALIIMTPLMAFLAVPMAKVNPRQGRFNRLVPALILYLLYFGMIMTVRGWIDDYHGKIPPYLNIAWVHLAALMLVVSLYSWPEWRRMSKQRKALST